MTVAIETSRVEYTGNGVTADFPTTFRFLEDEHLTVKKTPSGGVESILTLGVDYTVEGAGEDAGGTVVFTAAPDVDDAIVIERDVPLVQETALTTQGAFSAATHEEAFDYEMMGLQQLDRRVSDLEGSATTNNAIAGNGLSVSGVDTWHVGAGSGIQANADDIEVVFGVAAELATVTRAAADAGVLEKAARADHKHDVATAVPGAIAIGDAASEGASSSLSRADHVHELAAPGAVAKVNANAGVIGGSGAPAREDHAHQVEVGVPVDVGTANAEGAANTLARSNHVHAHGAQPLGDGTNHAVATAAYAGFMGPTDKSKLDGYGPSYSGTVTTRDGVATVVAARDVTNGSTEVHEVVVSGMKTDSTQGAGLVLVGTFRNKDGVVTQVGATTTVAAHKDDAAWAAAFVVSGAQVQVKVTGVAATSIQWRARVRVCEAP